jgi:hypothetical protein
MPSWHAASRGPKPSSISKKSLGPAGDAADPGRRRALTEVVAALDPASRMTASACAALGVSRATVHRRRTRPDPLAVPAKPRPRPARGLSDAQQRIVLDLLHEPRFADQAPAEIYASLLDEGAYHCSIRTMYRILDANGEVRERRDQLRHPAYSKPELLAFQRFVGVSQADETRGRTEPGVVLGYYQA